MWAHALRLSQVESVLVPGKDLCSMVQTSSEYLSTSFFAIVKMVIAIVKTKSRLREEMDVSLNKE
ncbi:hypothetical protein JYU34_000651, partial [Plutella xylostella]